MRESDEAMGEKYQKKPLKMNYHRREDRSGRPILAFSMLWAVICNIRWHFSISLHSFLCFLSTHSHSGDALPSVAPCCSRSPGRTISALSCVAEEIPCSTIWNTISYTVVEAMTLSVADTGEWRLREARSTKKRYTKRTKLLTKQ